MKNKKLRKILIPIMAMVLLIATATTALAWSGFPLTKKGANGNLVRTIQRVLYKRGYNLTEDSIFGTITEREVKKFQLDEGIGVDGKVGPQTWTKLKGRTYIKSSLNTGANYLEFRAVQGHTISDFYYYLMFGANNGGAWYLLKNDVWSFIY